MTRWYRFPALALLVLLAAATPAHAQQPTINTVAGGGLPTAGPATATGLTEVGGITRDSAGNFYFSSGAGVILKVDTSGNISVFAGNGTCCFSGDGGPATSAQTSVGVFVPPGSVKVNPSSGNIYFADEGSCVVREVNAATGIITTVAGTLSTTPGVCSSGGDGGPATSAQFTPTWLGFDSAGDLYISDDSVCVVRRVDHMTQIITTVAGNAALGCNYAISPAPGDGGPATSAQLGSPVGLVVDGAGNLYIADYSEVRVVNASTQIITAYAGGGNTYPPDGVTATQANLCCYLGGLAFDPSGNLLVALTEPNFGGPPAVSPLILRVTTQTSATGAPIQVLSVVAGNENLTPGFSGDGGAATSAQFSYAAFYFGAIDFVVDPSGDIFVADTGNYRVREISASTGNISTVAGNGSVGDGGPPTSALLFDNATAIDSSGNLFLSDPQNGRIREVSNGVISTLVGTDVGPVAPPSGDGGPATSAQLFFPHTLIRDNAGDLFIADYFGSDVREVAAATGTINLYAGGANCGFVTGVGPKTFCGDGGPATSAGLTVVQSLALDTSGNLLIADSLNNVVRSVNASTHIITTVVGNTALLNSAGTPVAGYSGDGGPATSAQLFHPYGLAFDPAGDLYIADSGNNVIREVYCFTVAAGCAPPPGFAVGSINTVAGNYQQGGGMGGDGGPANAAALYSPEAISFDPFGNLYIGDTYNFRVRVVNSVTGIITTLAGNGFPNFAGDSGPAIDAGLWPLHGNGIVIAPGSGGNLLLYVQDEFSGRVRVVTIPPVPAVYLTPAVGLAFTSQQTNTTSAAQAVTIANSGTGPLNVSDVSFMGTDLGDFKILSGGTCTGTSFTLAPATSCTVMVALSPADTGMLTASLTFTDNAPSGTQSVMLVGSGTPTAPPGAPSGLAATVGANSVTLNWTASATTGVTYSVYRMLQSGGACTTPTTNTYSLIASAISGTSYPDTDPSLMAGNTYCYAVLALLAGVQSTFSNVATAPLTSSFVPTLTVTMATLPNGAVGVPYGADIQVSGGTMPYLFSVTTGTLPTGFSMTGAGSGDVSSGHVYTTSTPPGVSGTAGAGTYTFGVTVMDSSAPPQTTMVTISLTIAAAPANTQASLLKGQYAVLLRGFSDPNGTSSNEQGVVGSLNFDGVGTFTGVIDTNNISGITQDTSASGTYSVGPDNRGFLTFTTSSGTVYVAFSVGSVYRGVAYTARVTQFNDNDGNHRIASGFLKLQDPTAFNQTIFACGTPMAGTCQGTFVFGLTGQDPALGRAGEVGLISFDNMLNVTGGSADLNDNGATASITGIGGTYTAPDTNGRVPLSLTFTPSGSSSSVTYIISANEGIVMTLDSRANNLLLIGSAFRQANPGTFTNSSLAGPDVLYLSGLSSGGSGSEVVVGTATAVAPNLTVTYDSNSHGNLTLNDTIGFNYAVASNGRVTATSANAGLILYLASPDRAFVMDIGSDVFAGKLVPQSSFPFSPSPFTSNVYLGDEEVVEAHEATSGIGVLASPGTLNLTADTSHSGGDLTLGQTAAFNFTAASNGRLTSTANTQIGGETGYFVSPYESLFFDTTHETGSQGTPGNPHLFIAQTQTAPPGTPSPAAETEIFPAPVTQGSTAQSTPVTFTNTGLGPMAFTGVDPASNSPDFSASGTCLPAAGVLILRPGASCTLTITFMPTMTTPTGVQLNETLILDTDGTSNVTFTLQGTAMSTTTCGTNTWLGTAGDGQWSTATNWSTGAVPVSTDTACIPTGFNVTVGALAAANQTISSLLVQGTSTLTFNSGPLTVSSGATVTLLTVAGGTLTITGTTTISTSATVSNGTLNFNGTATVAALTFSGGTVAGSGPLNVSGTFQWTGGTVGITSTTTASGPITMSGASSETLSAGTLTASGGVTMSGTAELILQNSAVWSQPAGTTFTIQGNNTLFGSSVSFSNAGTFQSAPGSGGVATIELAFVNSGTLNVQSGTLTVNTIGSQTTYGSLNGSGSYTVSSGATLQFANNGGTSNIPNSLSGAGTVIFTNSATVNVTGSYNITGATKVTGGIASLTGTITSVGPLTLSSGTINLSPAGGIALTLPSLTMSGGTFNSASAITVTALVPWSGGTIQTAGAFTLSAGATLGPGTMNLVSSTVSSMGNTTLLGAGSILSLQDLAVWTQAAGTIFTVANSGELTYGGGGSPVAFVNNGTFNAIPPTGGTAIIQLPFQNFGTLNVQGGTLAVDTIGSQTVYGSLTGPGMYGVSAGTTLLINNNGGTSTISGSLTGGGTVNVANSATLNISGGYNITGATMVTGGTMSFTGSGASLGPLTFSSGTITGTSNLGVGVFNWTGGTLSTTGSTAATGGINITGSGTAILGAGTLSSSGHTIQSGTTTLQLQNGAVFSQTASAVYDAQSVFGITTTTTGTFNNAGTFNRSGAAGGALPVGVTFNNTGTVNVQLEELDFNNGGSCTSPGSIVLTSGTILGFNAGTFNMACALSGAGEVNTVGGTFNFATGASATGVSSLFVVTTTTIASGVKLGIASVNVQTGGTLEGTGTITGNVSMMGGTVHPGMSPGILTIMGNYTQTGGTLAMDLAGTTAGTGYSQLVVSGTATLGGVLNVSYFGGFMAAAGNSFTLIEPGAVSGTFVSTVFPAPPTGTAFLLSYAAAPTGVVLQASSTAGFSASPNPLAFGNQPRGMMSAPMTLTFTNPGTSTLTITALTLSGGQMADFAPATGGTCGSVSINVTPGPTGCTVMYTFTPSTAAAESTTLLVTDNATGSPQTVTLTGTGTQPVVSLPTSEAFGTVPLNTPSATITVTVTNTGNGALNFTAISVTAVSPANNTDFAITGGTCAVSTPTAPSPVAPGGSCTVTLRFTPTAMPAAGATTEMESATLSFTDNASPATQTVPLSGTGTLPVVTFTPTAAVGVNFGAVAPGTTTAVFTETLAVAAGTGTLQLSSIGITPGTGAGPTDFAIVAQMTTCPTDGGAVQAGTSCVVAMTFTPSAAVTENATLTFAGTNLVGSPVAIPLTGLGASTAAGFTFTVQPTALGGSGAVVTLTPGESAIFPLIITPNTGFIGPITVTCGTVTPQTNTTLCSVGTPTVTITASPSPPVTVYLTFQTNCVVSLLAPRAPGPQPSVPAVPAPPVGAVLLLAVLAVRRGGRWRRGSGARGWVQQLAPVCGVVLLLLLVMTWTACVKDPPPAIPGAPTTPAGTYTLPVTATAPGGVTRTLTLTINVT